MSVQIVDLVHIAVHFASRLAFDLRQIEFKRTGGQRIGDRRTLLEFPVVVIEDMVFVDLRGIVGIRLLLNFQAERTDVVQESGFADADMLVVDLDHIVCRILADRDVDTDGRTARDQRMRLRTCRDDLSFGDFAGIVVDEVQGDVVLVSPGFRLGSGHVVEVCQFDCLAAGDRDRDRGTRGDFRAGACSLIDDAAFGDGIAEDIDEFYIDLVAFAPGGDVRF